MGIEFPLPPPGKAFLAGDGSSCFMGLPSNRLVVLLAGGDLGAGNRGFAAVEVPLVGVPAKAPPKLNTGAEGVASLFARVGSWVLIDAPKIGLAEVADVVPPKILEALVKEAGLLPNRPVGTALSLPTDGAALPKRDEVLGGSDTADFPISMGFAPKSVEAWVTGVEVAFDSKGLEPNGDDAALVAGWESALAVDPNNPEVN